MYKNLTSNINEPLNFRWDHTMGVLIILHTDSEYIKEKSFQQL